MSDFQFVILALLNALTFAAVVFYVVYRLRWSVDLERVAGAIAADILERHEDNVWVLEPFGTKGLVRTRYLELCAIAGLPESAADWTARRVWAYVEKAQALEDAPAADLGTLYE